MSKTLSNGTVHKLPEDFKKSLSLESKAALTWEGITPLARNEWICWIESVKREETRLSHIKRAVDDLKKGKRRPCCWYGCVHRTDKKISPSIQALVLNKKTKKV